MARKKKTKERAIYVARVTLTAGGQTTNHVFCSIDGELFAEFSHDPGIEDYDEIRRTLEVKTVTSSDGKGWRRTGVMRAHRSFLCNIGAKVSLIVETDRSQGASIEYDPEVFVWTFTEAHARKFFPFPIDTVRVVKHAPETEQERAKYHPTAKLFAVTPQR